MKKSIVLLAMIILPFLANAHIYWVEVTGSGKLNAPARVQIYFGEFEHDMREKGNKLASMKDFKAFVVAPNGEKIDVSLTQTETCWEGTFTPNQKGIYQIYAVNDTRGVVDWTKYGMGIVKPNEFQRAIYQVENGSEIAKKPVSYLDAQITSINEAVTVQIFKVALPYPKAKVKVTNPQGWEKALVANEQGIITFKPDIKGLYLIETDFMDKTSGKYQEKDYEAVRNKFSITLNN
jgi:uncharacterized GH25 family protein